MSLKWFRLHHEIITNEKVSLLSKEDRWHYISILCMKASGVIDNPKYQGELFQRIMCMQLDLDKDELHTLYQELIELHLIDEGWQPVGWDRKQYKSDTSTERVKNHRDKKKKRFSNVSVTKSNGNVTPPDTDTDTETDKEKTIKPMSSPAENDQKLKPVPYSKIVDLYHEHLPGCPKVKKLTDKRKSYIRQRHREDMEESLETWESYFKFISRSQFLTGKSPPINGRKVFIADLEWITNPTNYVKIYERKYHEQAKV